MNDEGLTVPPLQNDPSNKSGRHWTQPITLASIILVVAVGLTGYELLVLFVYFDQDRPLLVAGFGVVLSVLSALLIWSLASAARLMCNLQEREAHFRLMADAAPAVIWITDVNGKHQWVNRRWLRFVGNNGEDDFGRRWRTLIHPDDIHGYETIRNKAYEQQQPFTSDFRARRYDGQCRWLMSFGEPNFDEEGQFLGFIGFCTDITERKKAEEEAQLATQIFQNSSEAMLIADIDSATGKLSITSINPAHTQLYGYSPNELLGRCPRDIFCSTSNDDEYLTAIRRWLESNGSWEGEYWSWSKNADPLLIYLKLNKVYDSNGQAFRLISLSHDITARKEAEETIRSLSASLICAREDEARRISRDIHDDLGQQLSLLRLNLSILPRTVADAPDELVPLIDKLKGMTDVCVTKVREIAANLRPATLDMGLGLAVESLLNEFAETSGVACILNNDLDDNLQLDDTLATNVYRVMQEALSNVARHANAQRVVVNFLIRGDNLLCEICDDGVGFDPGMLRAKRSQGLAGMRERAAMLGGEIHVSSVLHGGTTVRGIIPMRMQR